MPDSSAEYPDTTDEALTQLGNIFSRQRAAARHNQNTDYATRKQRLITLRNIIEAHEKEIIQAINADFGHRSEIETVISEITLSLGAIRNNLKHLRTRMRERPVPTPLTFQPGRSKLIPQPLGVVGVISPWNYPFQLALNPAISAIAAGNCVMIKPSEMTPHTSALIARMINETFEDHILAVVTGGVEMGIAFSKLKFDHLFFTGSTEVGRIIAQTAAQNLTPVTLELGGKSPAIIDPSIGGQLKNAAEKIMRGKLINGGQTCIAPDYILVPEPLVEECVTALTQATKKLYPEINTTKDYSAMVSNKQFKRMMTMTEEAEAQNARVIELGDHDILKTGRKIAPTLIIPAKDENNDHLIFMREEIFGPILPIISYKVLDQAISYIQNGARPLSLYWFGRDQKSAKKVLKETHSGGVTINDTVIQFAHENLPFGGIGDSGMGAYHGQYGFDTFTHYKPIFTQSRFSTIPLLNPPYTDKTRKLINLVKKIF